MRRGMMLLVTGCLLALGCLGGRMYFDKPTRYDIQLSMIKMKKQMGILEEWIRSQGDTGDPSAAVAALRTEGDVIIRLLPDRNPVIWQEITREMQQTLDFLADSLNEGQRGRASYHFKRLQDSCKSCHVRYRVGINF